MYPRHGLRRHAGHSGHGLSVCRRLLGRRSPIDGNVDSSYNEPGVRNADSALSKMARNSLIPGSESAAIFILAGEALLHDTTVRYWRGASLAPSSTCSRPWLLRWGATIAELSKSLPGDLLVPHGYSTAT